MDKKINLEHTIRNIVRESVGVTGKDKPEGTSRSFLKPVGVISPPKGEEHPGTKKTATILAQRGEDKVKHGLEVEETIEEELIDETLKRKEIWEPKGTEGFGTIYSGPAGRGGSAVMPRGGASELANPKRSPDFQPTPKFTPGPRRGKDPSRKTPGRPGGDPRSPVFRPPTRKLPEPKKPEDKPPAEAPKPAAPAPVKTPIDKPTTPNREAPLPSRVTPTEPITKPSVTPTELPKKLEPPPYTNPKQPGPAARPEVPGALPAAQPKPAVTAPAASPAPAPAPVTVPSAAPAAQPASQTAVNAAAAKAAEQLAKLEKKQQNQKRDEKGRGRGRTRLPFSFPFINIDGSPLAGMSGAGRGSPYVHTTRQYIKREKVDESADEERRSIENVARPKSDRKKATKQAEIIRKIIEEKKATRKKSTATVDMNPKIKTPEADQ